MKCISALAIFFALTNAADAGWCCKRTDQSAQGAFSTPLQSTQTTDTGGVNFAAPDRGAPPAAVSRHRPFFTLTVPVDAQADRAAPPAQAVGVTRADVQQIRVQVGNIHILVKEIRLEVSHIKELKERLNKLEKRFDEKFKD